MLLDAESSPAASMSFIFHRQRWEECWSSRPTPSANRWICFLENYKFKKKKIKSAWNRLLKNLSWIKLMAESGFLMLTWSRWDVNVPANDHLGWSGLKLCGRNWWWQTSPVLYERRVMLWHDVSASNRAFSLLCSVNSRKPHCFRVKLFSWLAD